jgi:hypothetical protein
MAKLRKELGEALNIGKLDFDLYGQIKQISNKLDQIIKLDDAVRQNAKQILEHLIVSFFQLISIIHHSA